MGAIERQLRDPRMDDEGFVALRASLDRLRVAATEERDQFKQAATAAQTQLDALGPAPAAGQPRESAAVADSRRQLSARLQAMQDGVKQSELALARIVALQDQVADEARQQFTRQLIYRGASPFSPVFWHDGLADIVAAAQEVRAAPQAWLEADGDRRAGSTTLMQMAVVALLAVVLVIPAQRWLHRHYGVRPDTSDPSPVRRTVAAFTELMNRTAMPLAVLWAVYGVVAGNGWAGGMVGTMLQALLQALSLALLAYGLVYAILAPNNSAWAVIQLPQPQRDSLLRRVAVFVIGIVLLSILVVPSRSPDFGGAGRDLVIAAVALFLVLVNLGFADPRLWRQLGEDLRPLRLLTGAVFALNLVALAAILLGYYSAAAFLSFALLGSALALAAYSVVRTAIRDGLNNLADSPDSRFRSLRQPLGLSGPMSTTTQIFLGLLVDVVLFFLLLIALALAWGMSGATLVAYTLELFYGVTIGPVTISLGNILGAIVVLVVGVGITRLLSGGLNTRLEQQSGIDPGVRNSMVTGLTYAGYLLAGVAAIGAVGLDLSNLAIIAGALSVGIGFGLQNIVNNFVSGLILLIERPVKVGDWVVVGDREGYVRRINVRSTEIETFPRASVIIPNSDLISSPVMNWTHRNRLGRVDINIGLAYGTDVEKARDVLLECLSKHPDILSIPAPMVVFRDFGDSALMFALRGFIADVERRMMIESDLRFAIYKACNANGIEIPYAQSDVHLADIDRLEKMAMALAGNKKPAAD
ncbi:MAG: DUF3772 domain-containing protein [Ferrovibrio sp.]